MATKAAAKRLAKEYQIMQQDPPPYCFARPLESDVLTWHFILRGPPQTDYEGGEYWGQLLFPADYPFKPPGIQMTTPSGRFKENAKICTSMSDFHPGSWQPSWSVANILVGLHSFMNSEEITTGGMTATPSVRRTWAAQSHAWNVSQPRFAKIFPEYSTDKENATPLPNMGETKKPAEQSSSASISTPASTSTSKHEQAPIRDSVQSQTPSNPNSSSINSKTSPPTKALDTMTAARGPPDEKAAAPAQQSLLSTRSKVFLCVGVLAGLFVSRLISRGQSVS